MKVVLSVPWFLPESVGGTELYVAGLSTELAALGVECVVAVPSGASVLSREVRNGVTVVRFPGPSLVKGAVDSIMDSVPANAFGRFLSDERPDIYNQHEWSANCGINHLRIAKQLGLKTVITFHLPKILCRTNTMMYNSQEQCDGEIIERRCAACTLVTRGLPAPIARGLTSIPRPIAAQLSKLPYGGRAFSGRSVVGKIIEGLRQVVDASDKIVTVSQWQKQAFELNGVPRSQVVHVLSGFASEFPEEPVVSCALPDGETKSGKLRVGFLGRAHPIKGLHVLVEALCKVRRSNNISLRALVLVQDEGSANSYLEDIKRTAEQNNLEMDLRVNQPRGAVATLFRQIDVLAVPSQWTEGSPLVVWEAKAWRIPVVGSNLGGIPELVRNQVDGLLVSHNDASAWAAAFESLAQRPEYLDLLKSNIRAVRTMDHTARDTLEIYKGVLSGVP